MHRTDADGNVNGMFSDGSSEQGQLATVVDAKWLNTIQEELMHLLESANISPDDDDDGQIEDALRALFSEGATVKYEKVVGGVIRRVNINAEGLSFTHLHNGEEVLDFYFSRAGISAASVTSEGNITSGGNVSGVDGVFSNQISAAIASITALVVSGAANFNGSVTFASGKTVNMNGDTNVEKLTAKGSIKGSFAHDPASYWLLDSPTDLGQIDASKPRRFVAGQRVCFCNTSSSSIVVNFKVMKGSVVEIYRSLEPGKFLDCVVIGQDGSDWVYSHADSLAD